MRIVYVADVSTLEILERGYSIYEDSDICFMYSLNDEEEISKEYEKLLEQLSEYITNRVETWKKMQDRDRGVLRINDFIKQELIRYMFNYGFFNRDQKSLQVFHSKTKIINRQKRLTIKIFTEEELKKYKFNVQILDDIINQTRFMKDYSERDGEGEC